MYDATIGRFFSEDPIGLDAGDPNLYRYVGNDPVNGADPSGLGWRNSIIVGADWSGWNAWKKDGSPVYWQSAKSVGSGFYNSGGCPKIKIGTIVVDPGSSPQNMSEAHVQLISECGGCSTTVGNLEAAAAKVTEVDYCSPKTDTAAFMIYLKVKETVCLGKKAFDIPGVETSGTVCQAFGQGAQLGALNLAVVFTFEQITALNEHRDECLAQCDIDPTTQAISVGSALVARELLFTVAGMKVATAAAQGGKVINAANIGFKLKEGYEVFQAGQAFFASASEFDALWNGGFLALSLVGIAPDAIKGAKNAKDAISRAVKCGAKPQMKLTLKATEALEAIDIDEKLLKQIAEIDGQKIYRNPNGKIYACTQCKLLSPNNVGGTTGAADDLPTNPAPKSGDAPNTNPGAAARTPRFLDAAKRLGIDLDSISIANGVALAKLNYFSGIQPKDIEALLQYMKGLGANKVVLTTSLVVNDDIAAKLNAAIAKGTTYLGASVRKLPDQTIVPGVWFKYELTFDLCK